MTGLMLRWLWAPRVYIWGRTIWVCLSFHWIGADWVVISEAKRLLPKETIIGISASNVDEAQAAIEAGADYLGIGTLFATPT